MHPEPGFRCPICGTTIFERVAVPRAGGTFYLTDFFQCAGCSVMFRDAVRFTRCRRWIPGEGAVPRRFGGG